VSSSSLDAGRDERFMRLALDEARRALETDDVPVGCVLVDDASETVVAVGRNVREADQDPVGHAEVIALRAAARARKRWYLDGTTLYVTLEPCPMCAGALVNARVPRLVYGANDPKAGAVGSLMDLCRDPRLNHRLEVRSGVLAAEASELLKTFFQGRRAASRKSPG
jgi:tRNA(adenine34) deaminase